MSDSVVVLWSNYTMPLKAHSLTGPQLRAVHDAPQAGIVADLRLWSFVVTTICSQYIWPVPIFRVALAV
jgi:hypothetical protein